MLFLIRNIQETLLYIGWTVLALLIFIIIYRLIIKRMKRNMIQKELYLELHPIDQNPAHGTVQVYIEMHSPLEVELSVFSVDGSIQKVIEHKQYKKGGNVILIDTSQFENGVYFYQAKTHNQKTKKKFEIRN